LTIQIAFFGKGALANNKKSYKGYDSILAVAQKKKLMEKKTNDIFNYDE
jgi:hypothetical protein